MCVGWITIGRYSGHEGLKIPHDIRVRIFAQHERGAGVTNKNMAHAGFYSGFRNMALHVGAQVVGTTAASLYS